MAVDHSRHLNFFREMLSTSSNNNNNVNNQVQIVNNLYSHSNITSSLGATAGIPTAFYNLNDVVFQSGAGKILPAVKDDSGVTFNNSLVLPAPATRKRPREPAAIVSGGAIPIIASTGSDLRKDRNDFSFLGENLTLQIVQQQLELDRLISQHIEKMRIEIEDKRKHQLRRIISAVEESMVKRLRHKEEEIEKISKINWALEERVTSLCLENQIWRDLAQTNEATAHALRMNLEQVLHNTDRPAAIAVSDDAISCCGSSRYGGEEERGNEVENGCENRDNHGKKWIYRGENGGKRMCKKCGEGESSVLLLPCRHLCLCALCGPAVNSCPICYTVKNASVHVNLS